MLEWPFLNLRQINHAPPPTDVRLVIWGPAANVMSSYINRK
jgi:hypothetical protein